MEVLIGEPSVARLHALCVPTTSASSLRFYYYLPTPPMRRSIGGQWCLRCFRFRYALACVQGRCGNIAPTPCVPLSEDELMEIMLDDNFKVDKSNRLLNMRDISVICHNCERVFIAWVQKNKI
jgi:hypothetical protein